MRRQAACLLVRDSSAVWRLFVWLAGAVGRQSALHKENSGFAAPVPGRYISKFRGYQILFSIRNPYINRFTNHFSIHSKPSYPQKVVLHSITARFPPTPSHFVISLLNLQTWSRDTNWMMTATHCVMGATVLNAAHQIICIRKQHTNHIKSN